MVADGEEEAIRLNVQARPEELDLLDVLRGDIELWARERGQLETLKDKTLSYVELLNLIFNSEAGEAASAAHLFRAVQCYNSKLDQLSAALSCAQLETFANEQ